MSAYMQCQHTCRHGVMMRPSTKQFVSMQGCGSGYEDASNQLGDNGLALTDSSKPLVQPERPAETGSSQNVPLALDSTVQEAEVVPHTCDQLLQGGLQTQMLMGLTLTKTALRALHPEVSNKVIDALYGDQIYMR